ncbi:chloramphenicol-sensitive protein RarD [Gemmobacter megaterium]|uniref:Chloramphenicol-sensitive protein RarD n=1 Tax=Gemmobacter megaterium TaxID=1086013 RepID=A0A1N7K8R1_9RHOB|nr:EamA family transporter RarD [Gemmobacter megaterium]GGE00888.1 permease [Gemmobacter megaterium]SIS57979.1 chloramphenicol-sensitive protein RarD [Gemmobacter megaterium]
MTATVSMPAQGGDSPRGFAFALAAYLMWGFLPVYMKALANVPTLEVLAHRVLWSVPVALAVLVWLGRTSDLRAALRSPKMLAMAALTAALISVNWGLYVYAVQSGQAMEAALGYYINPLFSVLLGRVLLGERLDRLQWLSVLLAAAAVVLLTVETGRVPYLAIGMMLSWGFYAYFKKSLPLGPNQGFTLEVILLTPFALAWMVWLMASGQAIFLNGDTTTTALLVGAGIVTAVPLMVYANGAKLLRLATIGIMQYITPTLIFLTAVFAFGEPFGQARAIAFPMIWAALAMYTYALIRQSRR